MAQTIPAEIVQQVFAHFSPGEFNPYPPSNFPWFLGHVCSGWRSIFLSMTAEFWSTISLLLWKTSDDDRDRRARIENIVRFFLDCGHDSMAPLSFSLIVLHPGGSADAILEMLINESMRWSKVTFSVSDESELLPLTRVANRLPLLQELCLRSLTQGRASDPLCSVFQTAPLLNALDIANPNFGHWKFNWSNLKSVYLSSGGAYIITHLSQLPNLERLLIFDKFKMDFVRRNVVAFPNLTSLGCHSNWLSFLTAPALEELIIKHDNTDNASSFLRRSSCNISHLCLLSSGAASAIDIIRHTPQVSRLDLSRIIDMNMVLDQLIISNDPARRLLASCMSSLGVDMVLEDTLNILSDLILSRTSILDCASYKRLQRVDVFQPPSEVVSGKVIGVCKECGVQYTNSSAERAIRHHDVFRM